MKIKLSVIALAMALTPANATDQKRLQGFYLYAHVTATAVVASALCDRVKMNKAFLKQFEDTYNPSDAEWTSIKQAFYAMLPQEFEAAENGGVDSFCTEMIRNHSKGSDGVAPSIIVLK